MPALLHLADFAVDRVGLEANAAVFLVQGVCLLDLFCKGDQFGLF